MELAIETRALSVRFDSKGGSVDALRELTMEVPRGSAVGFLGPNGAGKTTAIHVLLGFISATSGSANILGRDVGSSIARERIGYLPENPQTYGFLTGRELLTFAGRLYKMPRAVLKRRIDEVLEQVDLAGVADRRSGTYSRGMLQRIGLAQALINDPDLLILDEPTGGLDPIGRMSIREVLSRLRAAGKTIFFSSHELSEVELICDRIILISHGRLVAEGPVFELVAPGESLERYFLNVMRQNESGKQG